MEYRNNDEARGSTDIKAQWLECAVVIGIGIVLSLAAWFLEHLCEVHISIQFALLFFLFWAVLYSRQCNLTPTYILIWSELLWIGHGIVLGVKYLM